MGLGEFNVIEIWYGMKQNKTRGTLIIEDIYSIGPSGIIFKDYRDDTYFYDSPVKQVGCQIMVVFSSCFSSGAKVSISF